ncbi:MAG TPA: ABC transporter permease [Spirochaetia bacterium]|nr:ABC transporter permease [Spirochaetia bacterium]
MVNLIGKRLLILIPLLLVISVVAFIIIQLPPGSFLDMYVQQLTTQGTNVSQDQIAALTKQYGLDKPMIVQYWIWISNIVFHGNFGLSFQWNKPVSTLIGERIILTMVISLLSTVFIWLVSVPIGIYSATHQYTAGDYAVTVLGFIGIATPGFVLALVFLWVAFKGFGVAVTGLFSAPYADAPWSLGKVLDMLKRIWVPVILTGLSGTAYLIRVLRGTLLDELKKQYVITARAKGLSEVKLLFEYPVRVAINPIISTIGWMLPGIISGELLVSIVLNLPTAGPLLWGALLSQDMFLAGSFLLILSALTVVGTLISDILLAAVDPRIRYKGAVK